MDHLLLSEGALDVVEVLLEAEGPFQWTATHTVLKRLGEYDREGHAYREHLWGLGMSGYARYKSRDGHSGYELSDPDGARRDLKLVGRLGGLVPDGPRERPSGLAGALE